jgi:hypothetical protein
MATVMKRQKMVQVALSQQQDSEQKIQGMLTSTNESRIVARVHELAGL